MNTSFVRSIIHIPVETPSKLDGNVLIQIEYFVSWLGNELSQEPKRFKMRMKSRFTMYK